MRTMLGILCALSRCVASPGEDRDRRDEPHGNARGGNTIQMYVWDMYQSQSYDGRRPSAVDTIGLWTIPEEAVRISLQLQTLLNTHNAMA